MRMLKDPLPRAKTAKGWSSFEVSRRLPGDFEVSQDYILDTRFRHSVYSFSWRLFHSLRRFRLLRVVLYHCRLSVFYDLLVEQMLHRFICRHVLRVFFLFRHKGLTMKEAIDLC